MLQPERESRPAGNQATSSDPGEESGLSLPPVTSEDWERAAAAVNGAFCVVVYVESDKVRRRLFLTLAAAERHADRARARGQECSVVLAELRPVFALPVVA